MRKKLTLFKTAVLMIAVVIVFAFNGSAAQISYVEDFVPLWGCNFENAVSVEDYYVNGTDVGFTWSMQSNIDNHAIAVSDDEATKDLVVNGAKSFITKCPGTGEFPSLVLNGPYDNFVNEKYYIFTFLFKTKEERLPNNFKYSIGGWTYYNRDYGFDEKLFNIVLEVEDGRLSKVSATKEKYYNKMDMPECAIKEVAPKTYSIAIKFQGITVGDGTDRSFLRALFSGDACEFALDDLAVYSALKDDNVANFLAKTPELQLDEGFESATEVATNNISGVENFRALRNPLNGPKMSKTFSVTTDKQEVISGEKSIIYSNDSGSKTENFAFPSASASTGFFENAKAYVVAFDFKPISNKTDGDTITVHFRSGSYKPVDNDYLFDAVLKYNSLKNNYDSEINIRTPLFYTYTTENNKPVVTLTKNDDGVYRFALKFYASKDRTGNESNFISLEMNGKTVLSLDNFMAFSINYNENIERYLGGEGSVDTKNITVFCDGNGTITPLGTVSAETGKDITFETKPKEGYVLDTIKVDNIAVITKDGKYTLTNVSNDHVVSATFKKAFYKMNIDIVGGGIVSPADGEVVTHGETVTLKFLPDGGYSLYEVKINGKSVTVESNELKFKVTEAPDIKVVFKER